MTQPCPNHCQESSPEFRGESAMIQKIAEHIQMQTGEHWTILCLTRYEEHWVAIAYQGGLMRDFLLRQTANDGLIFHVAEKTLYPLDNRIWRYSTGTDEPLE